METESVTMISGAQGRGEWEVIVYWAQSVIYNLKGVMKMDSSDSCTTMWMYLNHWTLYYLKMIKMENSVIYILPQFLKKPQLIDSSSIQYHLFH